MSSPFIFCDIHTAYRYVLNDVWYRPDFFCAPRGLPIREVLNYQFTVLEPVAESIRSASEERNSVMAKYFAHESALYASGTNKAEDFGKAASLWKDIANPDGTVNSAYGHLLWKRYSLGHPIFSHGQYLTPWEWAKQSLIRDHATRQAFLRFSLPEHQWLENKDQVCTMHGQFFIRDHRLHLTMVMRATDVVRGLTYDMPWFVSLLDKMVAELRPFYPDLQKGTYTHVAHSMHIYEKDKELVFSMLGNGDRSYEDENADRFLKHQQDFYRTHPDNIKELIDLCGDMMGKSVVDIGCGGGEFTAALHLRGADVIGVDASARMIACAQKTFPSMADRFYVQKMEALPYTSDSLDVLVSRYVLPCAQDVSVVLQEWGRILKPGGLLVCVVGHPFMQWWWKQKKDYFTCEEVSIPLFAEQYLVQEYNHTLEDYLSPEVLKIFDLQAVHEGPHNVQEVQGAKGVPDGVTLVFRKRNF